MIKVIEKIGGEASVGSVLAINGYVKDNSPYVNIVVRSSERSHLIAFKIDTGASCTVISAQDALVLGLLANSPNHKTKELLDFTGQIQGRWLIKHCTLFFPPVVRDENEVIHALETEVLVPTNNIVDNRPTTSSLLGLDVLGKFTLTVGLTTGNVTLQPLANVDAVRAFSIPKRKSTPVF